MHRRPLPPWRRHGLRGVLIAGLAAIACCFGPLSPAAPSSAQATGAVSPVPAKGTPQLAVTGTTEQVRQLAQCGGTMYAVGSFTEIKKDSTTYPRNNIFSFSASKPYQVTSWNPDVNGVVNSIALTSNCEHAYIGGAFTTVDGTAVRNIAEISTSTGAVIRRWAHNANKTVNTLLMTPNGHVLAGGSFTRINGSDADRYYASLNPRTGQNDGYLDLAISGHYTYPNAHPNHTEIYNQQLSPGGTSVLAEGVFTSVQGHPRQQIFMMSLGSADGSVTAWDPSGFNRHCNVSHPLYVKTATWSPTGSTVYVATTGFHPLKWVKGTYPLYGLCDVGAAFPATLAGGLKPEWIQRDGCYTLLSVAADDNSVFIGGHQLYGDDPDGCKSAGAGSYPDPGLSGLHSSNGRLILNAAGTAGLYSRSRGLGADDMLLTTAGLWIASDNLDGSAMCGGLYGHAGICFLPYS
jgi:hypothetical protein